MDRRGFLGCAMAVTALGGGGRQDSVPSVQGKVKAGRLYRSDMVQQRARSTDADNDEYIKQLERQMRCTCGCNLDIYTCRTTDFTCATSPAMHREVVALHQSGLTGEEILEDFMGRYGEDILMAPKPEGFNLAGYLVPGVLISLVGIALAWVLVRRQSAATTAGEQASATGEAAASIALDATPEELERLRMAIRDADQ